jgi:hypothetical protein
MTIRNLKMWIIVTLIGVPAVVFGEELRNLAPDAIITASGCLNDSYAPRFTADGIVPEPNCKADINAAWCLPQAQAQGATLKYEWQEPVTISEIVYYGRTGWLWNENFLAVQVYVDNNTRPIFSTPLQPGHGPQRITLKHPVSAKALMLRFPKADGGPNPGASEIRIYNVSPPQELLGKFLKDANAPVPLKESAELQQQLKNGSFGFRELLVIQRQELNPSHVYTYHNEDFKPGGGLYKFTIGGEPQLLVDSPEGQMLDVELSYDGSEMLFSWRKNADAKYQVYRMNIDGSGLVQLTDGNDYNFNACWLPDGGIGFLSTRKSSYAYCWNSPVGVLYRMDRDGANVKRLSSNYLNDFTPAVLEDGRLIYSRWEYVDRPAIPIQSLWTLHPDGTGLRVFFGNRVLSPATFMEARTIPGTEQVLCLLTAHNGPCRGAIGILDPRKGVNTQEAIRNITPEVFVGKVNEGDGNRIPGQYENPFPLNDTHYLVSVKGAITVRDYAVTEQATLLEPRNGMGFYNPKPIRAIPAPPVLPAGTSVMADASESQDYATVYLQDVHVGLEPNVQRGEVAAIRVVEEIAKPVQISPDLRAFGFQFPVVSCGASYAPKKIWGEVPVSPDGSACFRVPAGKPLYFMALDKYGRALQRMRSFTHFMPGESQSCMGCHEDRITTPVLNVKPGAFRQQPQSLTPPEWGRVGFSYAHIVQPVLDKHCVKCHNENRAGDGLDFSGDFTDFFNVSYETLARMNTPAEDCMVGGAAQANFKNPYTKWISSYNGSESNILEIMPRHWGSPASRLADVVLADHPDATGMKRVELSDTEKRRIFAWMDLNVPYYGTSDSNHRDRRGCRRMWPDDFDTVFGSIVERRCASCHQPGGTAADTPVRKWYLRVSDPEKNTFLRAPLAKAAGGLGNCGSNVFQTKDDPDYRALLNTFKPIHELLAKTPRYDMMAPSEDDAPSCCEVEAGHDILNSTDCIIAENSTRPTSQ